MMANSDFGRIAEGSTGTGPFVPAALLDLAQVETGTDINLDDLATEGMALLCSDLTDQVVNLSFMGKKLLQRALVETLLKRAYTDRTLGLKEPAPLDPPPVFIIAPFRSGTTLLHRMMAQDPQFEVTKTWQVSVGVPDQTRPEDAIKTVSTYLERLDKIAPNLQRLHPTGATMPEECFGLLEPSFLSPSFLFWAQLPNYQRWLEARTTADWASAYRRYAGGITALQDANSAPRMLLKSPFHLWGLGAVLIAFPYSKIIQLHRAPSDVMHSTEALISANRTIFARSVDNSLPTEAISMMETALTRATSARMQAQPDRFIDLRFDDLINDPLAIAQGVYATLGLKMSDQAEANIVAWLSGTPAPIKHAAINKLPTEVPKAFADYSRHAPSKIS